MLLMVVLAKSYLDDATELQHCLISGLKLPFGGFLIVQGGNTSVIIDSLPSTLLQYPGGIRIFLSSTGEV